VFDRLLALANMPIQRFGSQLISKGQFQPYMDLLKSAHRDENLAAVMCRNLISVDWQGYVYDCDFNQMLKLSLGAGGAKPTHLADLLERELAGARIRVADHCYGCTAGQGSSCGGALDGVRRRARWRVRRRHGGLTVFLSAARIQRRRGCVSMGGSINPRIETAKSDALSFSAPLHLGGHSPCAPIAQIFGSPSPC